VPGGPSGTGDCQAWVAHVVRGIPLNGLEYAMMGSDGLHSDGRIENPNHLLGAYPTLWPYGKGGIETQRQIDVPYNMLTGDFSIMINLCFKPLVSCKNVK